MPTPLTLEDISSFINFVNANLNTKAYTLQPLATWNSGAGKPLVSIGSGYGVQLGDFPSVPVTSVNGLTGAVVLDKSHVGLSSVPNVDCTNAANITTGLLPLSVIPAAALERLVHVADEAARFLLTTASVQDGDIVQQDDTGVMYKVVDDAQLNNATGYNEFVAGIAAAVDWSGILSVPSSISDMASATSLEKNTWLYTAGAWTSVAPAAARTNLDIPVKGTWDMTLTEVQTPFDYPPLDADVVAGGYLEFPSITDGGKRHTFEIVAGSNAAPSPCLALSTAHVAIVLSTGDVSDLPVPTSVGTQTALLLEVTNTASAPLTVAGSITYSCNLTGRDGTTGDVFNVFLSVVHAQATGPHPTGNYLIISANRSEGGTPAFLGATEVALALPETSARVLLYVDADTRQVGWMMGGVDQGWLLSIPASVSTLGLLKQTVWTNVEVADPSLTAEISVFHSASLLDITETSPLNPFVSWGGATFEDPDAPVGVEVSNRFLVSAEGSFNGVAAFAGDIVEFLSPTSIFVYPEAASVVRASMLSDYATTGDLGLLQDHVNDLGDDVTLLQGSVSGIQNDLLTVDNRSVREKFLAGGLFIAGFSTSGSDLDAAAAGSSDGVIVSSFDASGTYVGATGDFAGMTPGAVAYQDGNDSWLSFQPLPGDVYLYAIRVYLDGPAASVPVIFRATYLGVSPKDPDGSRGQAGVHTSWGMTNGDQDRSPILRDVQPTPYSGGFFGQLGWRLDEQVLAPNATRVRYVYQDNPNAAVHLDPLADSVTVVVVNESLLDVNRRVPLIIDIPALVDTLAQPDSEYEYTPVGATGPCRLHLIPVPSFADFEVAVGFSKGGVLPETPLASYQFMPSSTSVTPGSKHLSLEYRLVPAAIGAGPTTEAVAEVRRLDYNNAVVYTTPTSDWNPVSKEVEVMHLDGALDLAGRIRLPTPYREGQRLVVRTAVGYNGDGGDRWTTDGAYPAVGIHPDTVPLLPDRMRSGESLEFVACRAPDTIVGTLVTVTGDLVWSLLPGSRWGLPECIGAQAPAGASPYVQLQKDATLVEVPNTYTWGQPLRIVIGDASLAVEEGDRVVCQVFSAEVDTLVDGIHLRETTGSTADLPGSLDQSLLTPFDVRFTWQRVNGEMLLISREVVQEGSSLPLSASRLKVRTTAAQTADLTLTGSGGYVAKTGEFTAGSFALATHRIVVHARSGVSRSLSLEMLVRFSYNGTTYAKVAESILYSDLVNVPAGQMSVAINGANDNNLRIEVTSTVAETIDWNAEVQSTYS